MRERAVSTVVSYVLILGIVALLTSTLFTAVGGVVADQREQTVRSGLEVVGNHIAKDLDVADRLALSAGRSGTVALTTDTPERVAGTPYRAEIAKLAEDRYAIVLRSSDPDVSVSVELRTRTPIELSSVDGGALRISYDTERDTLVMRNA